MATSHDLGVRRGLGLLLLLAVSLAEPQHANSQNATSQGRSSGSSAGASRKKEEKAAKQKKADDTSNQQTSEGGNIDPSQYVGADTCKGCHEDVGSSFAANPHSKTLANKEPNRQGCEACHGPGQGHAEAGDPENIIRFESLSKAETSKTCSQCHDLTKGPGHELHLEHSKAGAGCLDCHKVHASQAPQHLLKLENAKLCSTCHAKKQ